MDAKVQEGQQWVNATYGGVPEYEPCDEDGITGWATMHCLTRGLQHELGITALSDNFGPGTLTRLTALGSISADTTNRNIVNIVQYGLFCKGYWGGAGDGVYSSETYNSVAELKWNAGVLGDDFGGGTLEPKMFKALLTMDAYVLVSGGREEVRDIQRWLNGRYFSKSTFFVIPCDGRFSRDVQQALMKAIQYEVGVPADQANGNFGPATQRGVREHPLSGGDRGIFVQLFSAGCVFNGSTPWEAGVIYAGFTDEYDTDLETWVNAFQIFSALPNNGRADYATWAQLLVSTGDPDRAVSACDTRFHISQARAQALTSAGYRVVGRYLDEDPLGTLDKEIQPGELDAIFAGEMRVFPISQYNGRGLSDFTWLAGYQHALKAHDRALGYGFDPGTVIYFAVDYDATDAEITSNIVPYFNGVQTGLRSRGRRYVAGVYGSRNVCTRVSSEAYTLFSFVAGMSWGFSGNLGYPLPNNWSFNQIKEFEFSAGADTFDLDRVVARPGSRSVGPENVGSGDPPVEAFLDYIDALYATAVQYGNGDPNVLVMQYLRQPAYDFYEGWELLVAPIDGDWIAYAEQNGPDPAQRVKSFADPSYGVPIMADHLGATANATFERGAGGTGQGSWRGDFGGWGGDLSTFYGEWRAHIDEYASGYAFCEDRLAKPNVASTFPLSNLIEDADGYLIGMALRNRSGARINEVIRLHIGGSGHLRRFTRFLQDRYGETDTRSNVIAAAHTMLADTREDEVLAAMRTVQILIAAGRPVPLPGQILGQHLDPFLQGYADALQRLADQE